MSRANTTTLACWLLLLAVPVATAAESRFALFGGMGTSDNVSRSVEGTRRETIATVGTQFGLTRESRRSSASINGDLSWLKYLDDTFDPELVGSAGADMRLDAAEGLLSWSVLDRYGQTRTDLLAAANPANRDDYNYFATGPDITLRMGSSTRLVAMGRYGRMDQGRGEFDSQSFSQALALRHDLSRAATVSLMASARQVDPDDAPVYDQGEVVAGYAVAGSRTSLRIQAGVSRVKTIDRSDVGEVLRVDASRRISERSSLSLRGGRETTDAGGSLAGWTGDALPPATSGTVDLLRSNTPFVTDLLQLGWRIQGRATTIDLGVSGVWEDSPEPATPARRRAELRFGAARQLGRGLRMALDLRHSDRNVSGQGGSTEETALLRFNIRLGRRMSLDTSAELSRFERDGQAGTAREHRFVATLRYEHDSGSR
jgi:hypothetical protein